MHEQRSQGVTHVPKAMPLSVKLKMRSTSVSINIYITALPATKHSATVIKIL